MGLTLQRYTLAVVSHLALIAAWYLFVKLGEVPKFVMPSPYETVQACWCRTIVAREHRRHLDRDFGGYILAVVVGIGIALMFSGSVISRWPIRWST